MRIRGEKGYARRKKAPEVEPGHGNGDAQPKQAEKGAITERETEVANPEVPELPWVGNPLVEKKRETSNAKSAAFACPAWMK